MPRHFKPDSLKSDLLIPYLLQGLLLITVITLAVLSAWFGDQLQQPVVEPQRVLSRSLLYVIAIVIFPMTNLIRYVQNRLNETMPLSGQAIQKCAKNRYLLTCLISMLLIVSVDSFGLIMFYMGDKTNTLYIFSGLSVLGLVLYRPKLIEYTRLVEALSEQKTQ